MQIVKKADSKGRLLLGAAFADVTFLVEENVPGVMVIKKAVTIPENEMWLHKNEVAIQSVRRGINQAKDKIFGADPMENEKDMSWLDEIEE